VQGAPAGRWQLVQALSPELRRIAHARLTRNVLRADVTFSQAARLRPTDSANFIA
jgi:hypothetical protein